MDGDHHIFPRDDHLARIIDSGGARCGVGIYELPSLLFGAFGSSKPLLRMDPRGSLHGRKEYRSGAPTDRVR